MTRTRKLAVTFGLAAAGMFLTTVSGAGVSLADPDSTVQRKPHSSYSVMASQAYATPAFDYDYSADCISDGVKGNATPAGGCGNATPA